MQEDLQNLRVLLGFGGLITPPITYKEESQVLQLLQIQEVLLVKYLFIMIKVLDIRQDGEKCGLLLQMVQARG